MPVAVLGTDPDTGPVARGAIERLVAEALPGWEIVRPERDGVVGAADARRADAVVVAGGTLGLDDTFAARRAGLAARLLDRPLAHLDVRGPGRSRRNARVLVRQADLLVVRGRWSAARLAATGAAAPFRVGAPLLLAAAPGTDAGGQRHGGLLAALRVPGDPERLAVILRRAASRTGLSVSLARWRTSRSPAADLALARAVAERVPQARVLGSPADHAGCVTQAADAELAFVQDTAGALTALAGGTPLVVETADPDMAVLASQCGQPVVGPGAHPDVVGDVLAATGAAPAAWQLDGARRDARSSLALLRLVFERGRAPRPPALPLSPWREVDSL